VNKVVAFGIVGLCKLEVNELVPVQAYATPPPPIKFTLLPLQTGELLLAVAVGKEFIIADTVAVAVQPLFVTTT
jgi:hypothetical protein